MASGSIYKYLKGVADYSSRFLNRRLPWRQAGATKQLLPAGAPYCPLLPCNKAQLPPQLLALFQEEIVLPAVQLLKLQRVSVSWHAVVFRNLRIFAAALAHPRELWSYSDAYLLKQWVGETIPAVNEPAGMVLVHNQWTSSNYYHWIVDSLPRLLLLQHYYPHCQLLMPAPIPGFIQESAAMLGFTNLLPIQKNQTLINVNLLVPEHTTLPGFQRPELLQQVRAQLLHAVYGGGTPPRASRRVFVSRRLQRVRRLLNEAAIEELLKQYGYELVEFEKLSFVEQIKLMSETECLISVHGAGLTNMLYLPATARVAELLNEDKLVHNRPEDFENLIYFRMAAALQLPYYCLPCMGVGEDNLVNEAHLQVDKGAFEKLLQSLAE